MKWIGGGLCNGWGGAMKLIGGHMKLMGGLCNGCGWGAMKWMGGGL